MRKTWLLFSQAVTVALAVLFVVATLKPEWLPQRAARRPSAARRPPWSSSRPPVRADGAAGRRCGHELRAAAKRAAPAVVSITASRAPARTPRSDDPMFRFFFGDRRAQLPSKSARSASARA